MDTIGLACKTYSYPINTKIWLRKGSFDTVLRQSGLLDKLPDGTYFKINGFVKDRRGISYTSVSMEGDHPYDYKGPMFVKSDQFSGFGTCR